ncbi:MAG: MFS transporter [Actinomycetales bacterium]|nr:MFS transporter [Actinomycetales bacterium]
MTAASADDRLTRGVLARYSLGEMVTSGFATLPGLVLLVYLTDVLAVPAYLAGVVVVIAKLWDIVVDPVVGSFSDRDLAAHGSRRRIMLLGAVLLPIFFVVTFAVPAGVLPLVAAGWVLLAYLLAATGFSLFQVPYNVLPAELSASYDGRTRLLSARVVMLAVAILLYGGGGPAIRDAFGDERLGYLAMAVVAGLVFAITIVITSGIERAVRGPGGVAAQPAAQSYDLERPDDSIAARFARAGSMWRTSRPFRTLLGTFALQALASGMMLAGAQYVAEWVLGDQELITLLFVALIAPALVAAPFWGWLGRRIGKERSYVIASLAFGLAAISMLLMLIAPGLWICGPIALVGVGYAGMQALGMSMLPDVIADDARRYGPGRGGGFGGLWTAGEGVGLAIGPALLGFLLGATGYLESSPGVEVVQPESAILGIILSFSLVPAVVISLSLIPFSRYPLRKESVDVGPAAPVVLGDFAPPAGAPVPPAGPQEPR